MSRRLRSVFALAMLVCIAALVVSPFADLPLTMVKAVHVEAHSGPVAVELIPAPLLFVAHLPQFARYTPVADRDVLSRTATYRC